MATKEASPPAEGEGVAPAVPAAAAAAETETAASSSAAVAAAGAAATTEGGDKAPTDVKGGEKKRKKPRNKGKRGRRRSSRWNPTGGAEQDEEGDDEEPPHTEEGDMPQKRFYRSRAHCNPLSNNHSFTYPADPSLLDWKEHYPNIENPVVTTLDVGCGFGGLTVSLAKVFPDELILGMEIRIRVTEFVRLKIASLRKDNPGDYQNASVIRTNSMVYLPNFFNKAQFKRMFFCFPDPHFKEKNHRRRIINDTLLTEYAFFLRPGGLLYLITDVEDLHKWHVAKTDAHPCFSRIPNEEMEKDPAVVAMVSETEEGKKVARMGGSKHWAVYKRLPDEEIRFSVFDMMEG